MVEMKMNDEVMAIFRSHGRPLLVGPPGTGKSAFARCLAHRLGLLHISLNLSQNEGIDVHGARIVAKEPMRVAGKDIVVTVQAPPDWAIQAITATSGVNGYAKYKGAMIVMEEITCINPGEFAPVLGILSEHRVADLDLNRDNILIMACCNPPELAAGGWELSPPAVNRFIPVNFIPDPAEWSEHFVTYWDNPPTITCLGYTVPEHEWSKDRAVIASFAKQFPDLINKPAAPDSDDKQFCSFRSLDMASRIKTNCRIMGLTEDLRQNLWIGAMGAPAAKQLWEYLNTFDLPEPGDVIDDPDSFDMSDIPSDKLFYLIMACVAEVLHRKRQGDSKKDKKTHAWVVD